MITDFIKSFHLFNDLFVALYIFLFPKKYDLIYVIYIFLISLHWVIFKNECIISYFEKKSLNKNYVLGSLPYELPHNKDITNSFHFYINTLKFFNIFMVIYRSFDNKSIVTLAILSVIIRIILSSKD